MKKTTHKPDAPARTRENACFPSLARRAFMTFSPTRSRLRLSCTALADERCSSCPSAMYDLRKTKFIVGWMHFGRVVSRVGVARAAGRSDAARGLTTTHGIVRPRLFCFIFSAWLVSLLAGCGGGDDSTQARRLDVEAGKTRFESYCAACHQLGGTGVEGRVPPLTGSPWVAGRESRLIRIVLHGLRGPIEIKGQTYNMEMPGFYLFKDEEVASVLSYVRRRYGGPSPPITAATVSRVRAATQDHSGYWTVDKLLDVP